MKIISINVGLPRGVPWQGKIITTAIFKTPIQGIIRLRCINLDGDQQADLSVHGGTHKAVYAYPSEHYEYWKNQLPDKNFTWGNFGENFTTIGVFEDEINIGDTFRVGTAEVKATQPRMPCFKLGIRFDRPDMVKRFLASKRTGIYFSVVKEGEVRAGDSIELISRDPNEIRITEITRLFAFEKDDIDGIRRILQSEIVTENWREYFHDQLNKK